MKITATRKEDLMRERDEYDAKIREVQDRLDAQNKRYKYAQDYESAAIENLVRDAIGRTSLELQIQADPYGALYNDHRFGIRIEANQLDKFNEGNALSWDWSARVENGEVVKESGSWSGLKATTKEQLDNLKESVRVLERINSLNWDMILKEIPNYSDYISEEDSKEARDLKNNRPKFEDNLVLAGLEEARDNGEWVKMEGRPDTDYYRGSRRGNYWVKIDSMTPKFANVHIKGEGPAHGPTDERISLAKLLPFIVKPVETVKEA